MALYCCRIDLSENSLIITRKVPRLSEYGYIGRLVIANTVKQSLFEIAKSALSLVLRLLQDFVLRNDNKERTSPNTCFSG